MWIMGSLVTSTANTAALSSGMNSKKPVPPPKGLGFAHEGIEFVKGEKQQPENARV
jgi:hypothetical protein